MKSFEPCRESRSILGKSASYNYGLNLAGAPEEDEDFFVGRQQEVEIMKETLLADRESMTISGPGGIGKTQLAVAFSRRHADAFSSVFWLNAKSEQTIRSGLVALAKRITKSTEFEGAEYSSIRQILAWFSEVGNNRWLIVYDNYTEAYTINKYFPPNSRGSILITTRGSFLFGKELRLERLPDRRDSLALLSRRSGRKSTWQDPDSIKLAHRLDGFPLTLTIAGSYLGNCTDSPASLLCIYGACHQDLEEHPDELPKASADKLCEIHKNCTLYSTLEISYRKIEAENQEAANLMRFFAYLDNENISLELLQRGKSDAPLWFQELVTNESKFSEAMSCLCAHSLAQVYQETYSLHECVHDWALHSLNKRLDNALLLVALNSVANSVTEDDVPGHWDKNRSVLGHGMRFQQPRLQNALSEICSNAKVKGDGKVSCGGKVFLRSFLHAAKSLADLYAFQHKFTESENMYRLALRGKERAYGPNDASTLNTVNSLGNLFLEYGRLAEAKEMYQQALHGREETLGYEHPLTLDTVNNLAIVYYDLGKLSEAEILYQRALDAREKALGQDHPSTLDTAHCLGDLYKDRNKLLEAEEMYLKALEGRKVLGMGRRATLKTIDRLRILYSNQGKLTEAGEMRRLAVQEYEKALGPEHLSTIGAFNSLGHYYLKENRLSEAEEMLRRGAEGYEKKFGVDHSSTLVAFQNLGKLYMKQSKLVEAENMLQRALIGFEKVVGADPRSILATANILGLVYLDQGKLTEAEIMLRRALEGHEKIDHTLALISTNHLGLLYSEQGRTAEAEELLERSLKGFEKELGPEQVETLDAANDLGSFYRKQGRFAEAEKMQQRTLESSRQILGLNHEVTLNAIVGLGRLRLEQNELGEAEEKLQQALTVMEKALGPDRLSTLDVAADLGRLYSEQGRHTQSKQLYRRAGEGYMRVLGPENKKTLKMMSCLKDSEKMKPHL